MKERERLIELLKKAFIISDDNYGMSNTKQVADYLIRSGVIMLPRKLNLPDELYRYMFDDDCQPVVVKCKVVKITGYGFTLKHPTDGREWEYKYNSLGYTVFLTKEETVERIKHCKVVRSDDS